MTDGDAYFAFELARELKQPNPFVMLAEMPHRVFVKWEAFYRAERELTKRAKEQAKLRGH